MSNENNNLMAEALAALDGKIQVAPNKVPDGETVVAIELDRDPEKSGKYMVGIDPHWLATGKAIAIRDGHVTSGNYIFGRFTNGIPKITACHYVVCASCGKRVLQPIAVWEAKDRARKHGVEVPKEESGMAVLKAYGSCTCSGKWVLDAETEKAEITAFAGKVLDAIANNPGPVPPLVQPLAFSVCPAGTQVKPLPQGWEWLAAPMVAAGRVVAPFDQNLKGDAIIFNPGFWLGHITDPHATGLFWVEGGKAKGTRPRFNPAGVDGL